MAGRLHAEALARVTGALPVVIPADPGIAPPEDLLETCSGFLFPGGRANVHPQEYGHDETEAHGAFDFGRDALALALIRAAVERGQPVLGVCRGFQELAVAFGATLHPEIRELPGRMNHRSRPRTRTDGGPRRAPAAEAAKADGEPQAPDHRRARLRAALQDRRRAALRADLPALRTRLDADHQQPALRRMDRDLRLRTPHGRAARPADPPRHHSRDERRQLSARPKPRPKGRSSHLITSRRIGPAGQCAMARASYVGSARAMALGAPPMAWFCTATWPVFAPPLTLL